MVFKSSSPPQAPCTKLPFLYPRILFSMSFFRDWDKGMTFVYGTCVTGQNETASGDDHLANLACPSRNSLALIYHASSPSTGRTRAASRSLLLLLRPVGTPSWVLVVSCPTLPGEDTKEAFSGSMEPGSTSIKNGCRAFILPPPQTRLLTRVEARVASGRLLLDLRPRLSTETSARDCFD